MYGIASSRVHGGSTMGPLVLTGLAAFGAAIGVGWVVASTSATTPVPQDRRAPSARRFAITSMAYAQGTAVLAAVAGILSVTLRAAPAESDRLLAAGPAVLGALIGLGLVARRGSGADRGVAAQGVMFILGTAVLGVATTILATVLTAKALTPIDGPFAALGLVAMAAALALGRNGAQAIRAMAHADEAEAKRVMARWVVRSALLQIPGAGASFIAIVLIVQR